MDGKEELIDIAEFEREAEAVGYNVRTTDDGLYFYDDTQMAWELWLAACTPKQQPTPDAAKLVEALESLIKGYVSLLEAGIDRITSLDGDRDSIPDMLRDARAALASYRKGGA